MRKAARALPLQPGLISSFKCTRLSGSNVPGLFGVDVVDGMVVVCSSVSLGY